MRGSDIAGAANRSDHVLVLTVFVNMLEMSRRSVEFSDVPENKQHRSWLSAVHSMAIDGFPLAHCSVEAGMKTNTPFVAGHFRAVVASSG